jgi:hypothetical protein
MTNRKNWFRNIEASRNPKITQISINEKVKLINSDLKTSTTLLNRITKWWKS